MSPMPCTREIHGPAQATIVSLIRVLVDTDKATVRGGLSQLSETGSQGESLAEGDEG